jgi:MGT family glycosyltransferase
MARLVFFGIPAHGHINPSLPVIRELIRRGESVIYYNNEEFRSMIEETGASFRPYDPPVGGEVRPDTPGTLLLIAILLEAAIEMLPRLLRDLQEDPVDYVIHDSVCPWGRYAAERLGLPTVCSTTTFALAPGIFRLDNPLAQIGGSLAVLFRNLPHFGRIRRAQKALARNYGIVSTSIMDVISNPAPLTVVYTSREVQPRLELFGANYLFVGPSIAPRHGDEPVSEELGNGAVIYISLGTIFNEAQRFYRTCMDALGGMAQRVVLSVGRKTDIAQLGAIPSNFLVRPWVPQLEVLSRASLFLTRSGANSVHEALLYGVPMLLFPRLIEQKLVSRQIAKLGAGMILSERVGPNELRRRVEHMLGTPSFRQAARRLSPSLGNSGGQERAAAAILEYRARSFGGRMAAKPGTIAS